MNKIITAFIMNKNKTILINNNLYNKSKGNKCLLVNI